MLINPDPTNAVQHAIKTAIDEVVKWWNSLSSAERGAYMASISPQDGIEPMDSVEMHTTGGRPPSQWYDEARPFEPYEFNEFRQHIIEDIRQAVRTELMVGDKPLSRVAGVLRDVGCEIPGWPVSSNQCRSAVHDITMNLLDRLHSEDADAGQYDCLITMASAICAFAEHIKREGALK
jgi:hypothetical protein